MEKTIVAISTALGNGGISIIRMSGSDSLSIASKVFSCSTPPADFEPRKMYLGKFNFGNTLDKCMCVYFKAPFSYTGDDVVEFHCHGGVVLTQEIYRALVNAGCVPATKGEFSKIAFLNGKLSLDEAEGIIDIINAESTNEIKAGYELLSGNLKRTVDSVQAGLTTMLAKIEVTLDYPEEDLEESTKNEILDGLNLAKNTLQNLLSTATLGRKIKDGTKVLIFGKTNAGKSSILNALIGSNRAIVTDIQGTTRDTLEEVFSYKGYKFVLIDSAGIRNAHDIVEKMGVERALNAINYADIILYIIDGSQELDDEDFVNEKRVSDKNAILVVNKCDLNQKANIEKLHFEKKIKVSTVTGENLEKLKEMMLNIVTGGVTSTPATMITNARHEQCLKVALSSLDTAIAGVIDNVNLDLISIDIMSAWNSLGDITGTSDNEKIIDEIFDKFCVGK